MKQNDLGELLRVIGDDSMLAKKASQKGGGLRQHPSGCHQPSPQDLAAKIAALERAKATKYKRDNAATLTATTTPKRTRAAACKQELRALYARLAQLQESDDDEDNEQAHDTLRAWGEAATQSLTVRDCAMDSDEEMLEETVEEAPR
ncbi:UNVERIFIED_CONTAM: hypothetical protein K2H54_039973 [Gekko kuhli]